MLKRLSASRAIATSVVAMLSSGTAAAQVPPSSKVSTPSTADQQASNKSDDRSIEPEIIVTAQKRSESIQKVPLAITALSGTDLARSGVSSLADVQQFVPNLNLGQQLGVAKIALRGIGLENIAAGAEGSIAFHVDGVFISRSIAALANFYDVERLEVLRGPQGTLYGRNATGGSINVITREPTEDLTGYANLTIGNFGRISSEGAVSGALVPEKVLIRLAFQTDSRQGYDTNIVTGHKVDDLNARSFRATLLLKPTDRLSMEISADTHRQNDRASGYHYLGSGGFSAPGVPITPLGIALGGYVAPDRRDIANEADPSNYDDFWGVTGRITYDLGSAKIKSITGYRHTRYVTSSDLDSTSFQLAPITQQESAEQVSEELQLAGGSPRLQWLLGFFYFHEIDDGSIAVQINDLPFGGPGVLRQGYFAGGRITTDALAAFGQASYEIVDGLKLTLGARYSSEKKGDNEVLQFDFRRPYDIRNPVIPIGTQTDARRFNSFTPRVALDYQVTSSVLAYASYSKGFKAGTYNLGGLQPAVRPEKVDAYEAGLKSTLFDKRLRLNLAGFYYKYSDLQVGKVTGQLLLLENAANATIYGLETELAARVTPRLEVNANVSWLHARFDRYVSADPARPFGDGTIDPESGQRAFNLAGNSLSQSPNFTFFIAPQYHLPTSIGAFSFRGEVAWSDRVFFTPFNLRYVSQGPKTKLNAFLLYEHPGQHWSAQLYVKNLLDHRYIGNAYVSSSVVGFPINGFLEDPRTFGVTFGFKY